MCSQIGSGRIGAVIPSSIIFVGRAGEYGLLGNCAPWTPRQEGLIPDFAVLPSDPGQPSFTPDYSCAACGSAIFTTAEREKARADQSQRYRDDYERDTGFLPGR